MSARRVAAQFFEAMFPFVPAVSVFVTIGAVHDYPMRVCLYIGETTVAVIYMVFYLFIGKWRGGPGFDNHTDAQYASTTDNDRSFVFTEGDDR